MKPTEHTPGPWKVTTERTRANQGFTIHGQNGEMIADTVEDHETVNGEVNARLIAAAPELLAALIRAQDHLIMSEGAFVCDGKIGHSSDWKEALQQVCDALTKAKGDA